MTGNRKQELSQLLGEAMEGLEIRDEYGVSLSLPEDVYRSYLKESWKHYGLDCFYPHWIRLSLDIVSEKTKSRLLGFIREELALFLGAGGDTISATTCLIESTSNDRPSVSRFDKQHIHLDLILKRLLDIALVRCIEEAVSVFDRCSRPEGAHGCFQDVSLVEGLKVTKDLEVSKGVRLVPLQSSEISRKVSDYLPRFPYYAFLRETSNFGGKTLLVIDRPGFSIFHERGPDGESPLEDLPFQIGEQNVIIRTRDEIDSFQESFTQALSLILNHRIQITYRWFCLGEERTFNLRDGSVTWPRHANRFRIPTEASEADIEKAKCLKKRLEDLDSGVRDKLQIAIDRWINSRVNRDPLNQIIDLGIALEVLYVPDGRGDITYKLAIRAARHLGKDKKDREDLLAKFKQIYNCRSKAVHAGHVDTTVKFGEEKIGRSKFITHARDLCLRSITKILDEGKFTDWDSLILGGEVEEVSS